MAKNKFVLQSFVTHRVTLNFRNDKGKAINGKTVTVPSRMEQPKNILVLSPDDYKAVEVDLKPYLNLGQGKGIAVIDDIPSGYWNPTEQVAAERAAKLAAESERDGAVKRAQDAEAEIERLTGILTKTYGWKDDGK